MRPALLQLGFRGQRGLRLGRVHFVLTIGGFLSHHVLACPNTGMSIRYAMDGTRIVLVYLTARTIEENFLRRVNERATHLASNGRLVNNRRERKTGVTCQITVTNKVPRPVLTRVTNINRSAIGDLKRDVGNKRASTEQRISLHLLEGTYQHLKRDNGHLPRHYHRHLRDKSRVRRHVEGTRILRRHRQINSILLLPLKRRRAGCTLATRNLNTRHHCRETVLATKSARRHKTIKTIFDGPIPGPNRRVLFSFLNVGKHRVLYVVRNFAFLSFPHRLGLAKLRNHRYHLVHNQYRANATNNVRDGLGLQRLNFRGGNVKRRAGVNTRPRRLRHLGNGLLSPTVMARVTLVRVATHKRIRLQRRLPTVNTNGAVKRQRVPSFTNDRVILTVNVPNRGRLIPHHRVNYGLNFRHQRGNANLYHTRSANSGILLRVRRGRHSYRTYSSLVCPVRRRHHTKQRVNVRTGPSLNVHHDNVTMNRVRPARTTGSEIVHERRNLMNTKLANKRGMTLGKLLKVRVRNGDNLVLNMRGRLVPVIRPTTLQLLEERVVTLRRNGRHLIGNRRLAMPRILVLNRVPLATTVVVTPTVTFPKGVSPLKITGLVARRIRMTLTNRHNNSRTGRLIRDRAPIRRQITTVLTRTNMRVNITRTRRGNLVPRRHLIIELTMTSVLLFQTTTSRLVPSTRRVPLLISILLSRLSPRVQRARKRAMIGTSATIFSKRTRTKRTKRILNRYRDIKVGNVGRLVNRLRVNSHLNIDVRKRVRIVTARNATRTIVIMRRKNSAIGTRSIGIRRLRPVTRVKRRRVRRLILIMVGRFNIPNTIITATTLVGVLVQYTIGLISTLNNILRHVEICRVRRRHRPLLINNVGRLFRLPHHAMTKEDNRRIKRLVAGKAMVKILRSNRGLRNIMTHHLSTKRSVLNGFTMTTRLMVVLNRTSITLMGVEYTNQLGSNVHP